MKHRLIPKRAAGWIALVFLSVATLRAEEGTNALSAVARRILDPATTAPEREFLIASNSVKSAELVGELVQLVKVGTDDEYRGIPWIWRAAIAAGKRNDAAELKSVLSISLPKDQEELRDWQAVVIGGGIINGLSQQGIWPDERIKAILGDSDELQARWRRSLGLASAMADDEKVRHGTRYDALRVLGAAPWKSYGTQLAKYLGKGVNGELQQGAVSGLSDVNAEEAADALIANFDNLTEKNRQFALDALLRNDFRIGKLLDAMAHGKIASSALGAGRIEKLRKLPNEKLRRRFEALNR